MVSALAKRTEMTSVEWKTLDEFDTHYERLKDVLENRIRIGSSFVQVRFAE